MADDSPASRTETSPEGASEPRRRRTLKTLVRRRWRAWLRALHRDAGYLAVGLTLVYALSGLAINHIKDWDPNFSVETETHQLDGPIPRTEAGEAAAHVSAAIGIDRPPADAFIDGDTLEVYFDEKERRLVVDLSDSTVVETYKEPRFLLRVANWLHYNRGKKAWTYIADGYAVFLLFLAVSGLFMIKGKKGLIGRGAIIVAIGVAVPILYVHFSGGP